VALQPRALAEPSGSFLYWSVGSTFWDGYPRPVRAGGWAGIQFFSYSRPAVTGHGRPPPRTSERVAATSIMSPPNRKLRSLAATVGNAAV
jgi:hypothetical protein